MATETRPILSVGNAPNVTYQVSDIDPKQEPDW